MPSSSPTIAADLRTHTPTGWPRATPIAAEFRRDATASLVEFPVGQLFVLEADGDLVGMLASGTGDRLADRAANRGGRSSLGAGEVAATSPGLRNSSEASGVVLSSDVRQRRTVATSRSSNRVASSSGLLVPAIE